MSITNQSPYAPCGLKAAMPRLLLLTSYYRYYGGGGSSSPQSSSAVKSTLNALFDKYREADAQDKDVVGAEGTMKFFEDIGVNAEDLDALATFEIIQAPTMGEMSREGFVKGWTERK
jgi:DCN1-like protein 1/2